MIELKGISTGYSKNHPLLSNFSCKFDNKIYGILGKSGVGKTTLLRTIAGLMKPLDGQVFIDGEQAVSASKNGIYMMHQNYTSFDWLTCLDNILIAKKIRGRITDSDVLYAKEMLKAVMLDGYEDRYPRQLSGGQKQRLALARTLFFKPSTVLMDEPLSALDGDTRSIMQELVIKNHIETNNTIIIVTHSKKEAYLMCDVIIELT